MLRVLWLDKGENCSWYKYRYVVFKCCLCIRKTITNETGSTPAEFDLQDFASLQKKKNFINYIKNEIQRLGTEKCNKNVIKKVILEIRMNFVFV